MAPGMMIIKNNPPISKWTLENGYEDNDDEDFQNSYPIRVFNAKQTASLILYLSIDEKDFEHHCRGRIQGFKVYLSTPSQSGQLMTRTYRISLLEQADLLIRPKMITTSEGLRSYKPNKRQCFFNSERKLYFFKTYSLYSCETECLANFTRIECGCVKFHLPSRNFSLICSERFDYMQNCFKFFKLDFR